MIEEGWLSCSQIHLELLLHQFITLTYCIFSAGIHSLVLAPIVRSTGAGGRPITSAFIGFDVCRERNGGVSLSSRTEGANHDFLFSLFIPCPFLQVWSDSSPTEELEVLRRAGQFAVCLLDLRESILGKVTLTQLANAITLSCVYVLCILFSFGSLLILFLLPIHR